MYRIAVCDDEKNEMCIRDSWYIASVCGGCAIVTQDVVHKNLYNSKSNLIKKGSCSKMCIRDRLRI